MKLNNFFTNSATHFIILLGFLILSALYSYPVLDGKTLNQHDMIQATGGAQELTKFKEATGETSWWTNSMFGGMPAYTIKGEYPSSLTTLFGSFISFGLLPSPISLIFLLLVGCYIMLASLRFSPWVSALGALGYAFTSYNFIIIEAGHVSKVLALAYAPIVLAGTVLLYRQKYFSGAIIFALGLVLELYSNHIQITYYLALGILVYIVYKFIKAIKEKFVKPFVISSLIALGISLLVLGSMASKFWTTYEYTKFSIRGPAVLKSVQSDGGLDKEYAFSWSYGIAETFTFLVPNFYGGYSSAPLSKSSETYETLLKYNLPQKTAQEFVENIAGYGGQLYWGDQPNTSGPAYLGAVILFLFVLSFFLVKDKVKWVVLGVVALFTMLSWGKNFMPLTDLFFYYVPLYNKFRAVTMIHGVIAIFVVLMGCWGLKKIINQDYSKADLFNGLKLSTGLLGGLLVLFIIFGGAFRDFQKEPARVNGEIAGPTSDQRFLSVLQQVTNNQQMAQEIYDSFIEDRARVFRVDSIRSLAFILLAAAVVWGFYKNKLKATYLIGALILLVIVDMWLVSKRYLDNDDFVTAKTPQKVIPPSPADLEILRDKDLHYRVFNTTVSPFNDATTSFYHKSIGGYSGAKLRRYQDLIEHHLSKGSMPVINMLNTKYFIVQNNGNVVARKNPEALGNAWFVDSIKWVGTPEEEIDALDQINTGTTAVVQNEYKDLLGSIKLNPDAKDFIRLVSYAPNKLVYEAKTDSKALAVFSEIYYNDKLGWEVYIDGEKASHFHVNYVLRGMVVPEGKHEITFVFNPKSYVVGEKIALTSSILLIGMVLGVAYWGYKKQKLVKE